MYPCVCMQVIFSMYTCVLVPKKVSIGQLTPHGQKGFFFFFFLSDIWELNTGPLQDQQALLNTEPSVLPLLFNF